MSGIFPHKLAVGTGVEAVGTGVEAVGTGVEAVGASVFDAAQAASPPARVPNRTGAVFQMTCAGAWPAAGTHIPALSALVCEQLGEESEKTGPHVAGGEMAGVA
eukprot:gene12374-biopygen4768